MLALLLDWLPLLAIYGAHVLAGNVIGGKRCCCTAHAPSFGTAKPKCSGCDTHPKCTGTTPCVVYITVTGFVNDACANCNDLNVTQFKLCKITGAQAWSCELDDPVCSVEAIVLGFNAGNKPQAEFRNSSGGVEYYFFNNAITAPIDCADFNGMSLPDKLDLGGCNQSAASASLSL